MTRKDWNVSIRVGKSGRDLFAVKAAILDKNLARVISYHYNAVAGEYARERCFHGFVDPW